MGANALASFLEEAWEREHRPGKRNSMYLGLELGVLCVCAYVHMHIHVCGAQSLMSHLFLDHFLSHLSSHSLRLELTDLSRQVGLSAPNSPRLCLPVAGIASC